MGALLSAVTTGVSATPPDAPDDSITVSDIRVPRADTPPVVDGRLDDPVWQRAVRIEDFTQVSPREGAAPTERTEVYLLYTSETFFVGIRAYDRDPDAVRVRELQRDVAQSGSDSVAIVFDTFFDRRNGFYFQINPGGARRDGLVEDQSSIRFDWKGIWEGRAVRDELGWTAEMAIPFKTLAFDPEEARWGFNVQRFIRRKNETIRWRATEQDRSLIALQHAGVLDGLEGLNQGLGIDVKPSLTLSRFSGASGSGQGIQADPSLDIFYKPHPSLTAALTLNTDFAQTEVDERQINLTRFPLFFPEKRAFFLQDAGVFDFGGLQRSPLPFFSRRIGIGPRGQEQDIRAGLKVTGRTPLLNFGLLSVQMADDPLIGRKHLSVGRVSANVLEESSVGIIGTHGDPTTSGDNHLIGADFNYRNSRDFGDATVSGSAWIERTSSSGDAVIGDGSDELAFGTSARYSSDTWFASLNAEQIGAHLNPALGFVRRRAVRQYFSSLRHRWRFEGPLDRVDIQTSGQFITDLDDRLETLQITPLEVSLANVPGDQLSANVQSSREVLTEPFEISPGVVIPSGRHDWHRGHLVVSSSTGRDLRGFAVLGVGGFFGGDRQDFRAGVEWRASAHFFASTEFERNRVDLPQGNFTTDIARLRINLALSPDLTWSNLVQYDNVSELIGSSSRLQWIMMPGNELFLVLRQNFQAGSERFRRLDTDVAAKVNWTLRF